MTSPASGKVSPPMKQGQEEDVPIAATKTTGPAEAASENGARRAEEKNMKRSFWRKAGALLAIGFAGVIAVRLATISGGLAPWEASVANAGTVTAGVGLLLAAAYLSAQAIASIRFPPDRTRSATLAIALTGLRADETRTTAIAGAVAVPVAV